MYLKQDFPTNKLWMTIAAVNLALAVMFGAFGAHALKAHVQAEQLAWWATATDYFFYHALGLLALAILNKTQPHFAIKGSFLLMQLGIVLFCGSLYGLTLGLPRSFALLTPIGGLLMITAWLWLAYNAYRTSGK